MLGRGIFLKIKNNEDLENLSNELWEVNQYKKMKKTECYFM